MNRLNVFRACPAILVLIPLLGAPYFARSQEITVASLGMRFRTVPASEFAMGYDHSGGFEELLADFPRCISPRDVVGDERPKHQVRITQAFDLAVHEVTVGQFRAFCDATGYRTTAESTGEGIIGFAPASSSDITRTGNRRPFARRAEFTWRTPGLPQSDQSPVVGVSWEDAIAFCRWLSEHDSAEYRLPTEAEWECACRAGTTTWFSFGDRFDQQIHRHANIADATLEKAHPELALRQWLLDINQDPQDRFIGPAPVGSFAANPWGFHDLHGNVWEWCQDRYLANAYQNLSAASSAAVDPLNHQQQDDVDEWRVIRGGAWCNGPIQCRSAARGFYAATDSACYLGFRIVRIASPSGGGRGRI